MPKPLIIFDVDGTLIGGESYDWAAFDDAFKAFSSFNFPSGFFDVVAEVTGQAIVRRALPDLDDQTISRAIETISAGYAARLAVDISAHPEAFDATPGAIDLIGQLTAEGYTCAIATGDWFSSIEQKLNAAKFLGKDCPWPRVRTDSPERRSSPSPPSAPAAPSMRRSISATAPGICERPNP